MSRVILLDAGPLGLVTKRRGVPEAESCRAWVARYLHQGARILVPAIAYYEVCRELERMRNAMGLARMDAFCSAVPDRYVPLSDAALRLGCHLWAQARHAGTPTAAPSELDCDVLLAAQALTLEVSEADRVIATTNVGHLAQFVAAGLWTQITS
jgi:predicted nucleic acid-binding protein